MNDLYLGVDAGNSKTVALIADARGVVVGRGRAGAGDIYGGDSAEAVEAVCTAVSAALRSAGSDLAAVRHGAFRLAGVDWPEDEAYWQRALPLRLPGLVSCSVKNDGFSLLRCGNLSGTGVAITAGTGPAVAARGAQGEEFCACWWIQDLLGGRGLGSSAFIAVIDAELGLGRATSLNGRLLDLFGLPDAEALLHAFTRRDNPRPARDKWQAARAVLQASADGDEVAQDIVRSQARRFAGHARVAAERVGFVPLTEPVTVLLGGSVLTSEYGALRHAVAAELVREMPAAVVGVALGSPAAGTLLDAMAEAGHRVSEPIRDQIMQAEHPEDFLLTP